MINDKDILSFLREEWSYLKQIPLFQRLYCLIKSSPNNESELSMLPMLTKELLETTDFYDRIKSSSEFQVFISTSGTTGQSIILPWTKEDEDTACKIVNNIHSNIKWKESDVILIFAPLNMSSMWRHMQRQAEQANASLLLPGIINFNEVVKLMVEYKVTILLTLPSYALRIGEYNLSNKIEIPSIRQVACGGDVLSTQRIKRIKNLWKAECVNFYGLSELMGPIAGPCKCGDFLQIDTHFYYEILQETFNDNTLGELIITALWHRASPIVRYKTGDIVSISRDFCRCGLDSGIVFHGKAQQCPKYNGKRILLDELDDIILKYDAIGVEWLLDLTTKGIAELHLECVNTEPSTYVLAEEVSDYLENNIHIKLTNILENMRKQPKPFRILF